MGLKPLLMSVALMGAGVARAEEPRPRTIDLEPSEGSRPPAMGPSGRSPARPRAIWLECKAPAVWPARAGTPVRLTCRLDAPVTGPAFWQTVNPFRPDRPKELLDPFDPVPRYVDLFEMGRYARPRTIKVIQPSSDEHLLDELMSPFEVYPDSTETLNPFEPQREESQRKTR